MADAANTTSSSDASTSSLAEQLDEVQLIETMVAREGEFEWRQERNGLISGRIQVFLNLEREIDVCMASKESGVSSKIPKSLPQVRLAHLPPVSLHFELPLDYPQSSKPSYSLSCEWLNFSQLTVLCGCLDSLWEEGEGGVVLYNWLQFLTMEILKTLKISSELVLRLEDPLAVDEKRDKRAVQEMRPPSQLLPFLVDYDKSEREREFSESFFDCEICFSSLPGRKCRRIEPCMHIHCYECLQAYVTTKIGGGEVSKIGCPSGTCEESLSLSLIQELVSAEVFEQFDRLLLQKTLDKMTDVVYCPRPTCRCATLREDGDTNMALCPRCRFSFCILCKRSWHGVESCKLLPGDMKELRETWESLSAEERKVMEQQYGKSKLETAFQEHDSMQWLESNSRKCPNCQANIQKALGCNKMTCTHCRVSFCWLCTAPLSNIDPYKHFRLGNSTCAGKLFEGLTDEDNFWF